MWRALQLLCCNSVILYCPALSWATPAPSLPPPSRNVLQTPPSQSFHSELPIIEEGIQKWRCRERKDIGMEEKGTLRVRERCGLVIWDHRSVERFLVSELRGAQLGWHVPQHQPWAVVLSQPNPFPCVSLSCHAHREKQSGHSDWNVSIFRGPACHWGGFYLALTYRKPRVYFVSELVILSFLLWLTEKNRLL